MKIGIRHQESYSRGQLLLRSFFGIWYIGIPHMIPLLFLQIGAMFIGLLNFWIILFTGKMPENFFNYLLKLNRWNLRLNARLMNLSDGYPAFGLDAQDPDVVLEVKYPESINRGLVLARALFGIFYVMIPHAICLMFLQIGAMFVALFAWFAVLFTGKYPEGMFNYMTGLIRWGTRIGLYLSYMTDVYPPFSMQETEKIDWNNSGKKTEDHLV